MPFKDLREFIARLEKEGQIQRIEEEVDWNLEVGAIVRKSNEEGLPAPFFNKIKGYSDTYKIFGTPLASFKRIAIAMDMKPNTSQRELIEKYLCRKRRVVKPVLVSDGSCKENIHIGDEVDLLEFPVPLIHDGDGGRYIGTFHLTINRDLDSDWVNWGMYRLMLHNRNTIGILADPNTHLGTIHTQKYVPRNKAMEVAIAIGVEPISTLCAASPSPYGVSEVDVVGGIRGEPVELIKCETVDLLVPATSEIVIEGEMMPSETMVEGPFGEYVGYMAGLKLPRPIIRVKAVTHRNNPILTMTCEGMPTTDTHTIMGVTRPGELLDAFRERGLPVTGVCMFAETGPYLAVVAIKATRNNLAEEIAHVIWATRIGRITPYVIVVEDDVDPFDLAQVVHAMITKCHPYRGIVKLEHTTAGVFMPWANEYERKYQVGGKVYFDCTWPLDWDPSIVPTKISFEKSYPLDIQKKALAKLRK